MNPGWKWIVSQEPSKPWPASPAHSLALSREIYINGESLCFCQLHITITKKILWRRFRAEGGMRGWREGVSLDNNLQRILTDSPGHRGGRGFGLALYSCSSRWRPLVPNNHSAKCWLQTGLSFLVVKNNSSNNIEVWGCFSPLGYLFIAGKSHWFF